MNGPQIERLIQLLGRLPGLGPRSARRVALHLLKKREALMQPLSAALADAATAIRPCSTCGNLDTIDPCSICADPKRDPALICVVEDVGDLWAMERGRIFAGRYHVLGGTLSALDGVGPDELNVASLLRRVAGGAVREVIVATNATVDGQTTAHYLAERLANAKVQLTRLAHGVPVGGELDWLDDGTLATALKARRAL
jgi:recombination protein RecR